MTSTVNRVRHCQVRSRVHPLSVVPLLRETPHQRGPSHINSLKPTIQPIISSVIKPTESAEHLDCSIETIEGIAKKVEKLKPHLYRKRLDPEHQRSLREFNAHKAHIEAIFLSE
jgi:hypothetical protein